MNQERRSSLGGILVETPTFSLNETFVKSSKSENFNSEVARLSTFSLWSVQSAVDPTRLAKSGFYYTGKDDEVVCFSCNGHIKNWQYGDIVQRKHKELFPNCDFVNNRSNNIPFFSSKGNQHSPRTLQNGTAFSHTILNGEVIDNHSSETPEAEVGTITYQNSKLNLVNFEGLETPKLWRTKISTEALCKEMKSEEKRLQSFKKGWPLSFVDSVELAQSGFFYLGIEDKVQCPYCKGVVSNWEIGDKPLEEHSRHFPTCPFVIAATNITSSDKDRNSSWYENKGSDVCGKEESFIQPAMPSRRKLLDKHQEHTSLEELGVSLHRGPVHPQQATIAARLRSFTSWPSSVPVEKEDLAYAGFFYIGISDHTKCFYCDGGLCSWEPGDDPWVEHARWFRNCNFVHLNKGEDFIKSCILKYETSSESELQTSNESAPMDTEHVAVENDAVLMKADEAMKSSMITAVLETGVFPLQLVRTAVIKQIQERGTSFESLDQVCEAVQFLQQEIAITSHKKSEEIKVPSPTDLSIQIQTPPSEETSLKSVSSMLPHAECSTSQNKFRDQDTNKSVNDQRLCKICMDKEAEVVFLPCRHMLACALCTSALKTCPLCREVIQATVTAYIP